MADDVRRNKARGWVALVAGVFVVVLMSGVWLFVARALGDHTLRLSASDSAFLGQTFVAFALVVVSGFLGIANGIAQIRSGRRNRVLSAAVLIVFLAAVGTVAFSLANHKT